MQLSDVYPKLYRNQQKMSIRCFKVKNRPFLRPAMGDESFFRLRLWLRLRCYTANAACADRYYPLFPINGYEPRS